MCNYQKYYKLKDITKPERPVKELFKILEEFFIYTKSLNCTYVRRMVCTYTILKY